MLSTPVSRSDCPLNFSMGGSGGSAGSRCSSGLGLSLFSPVHQRSCSLLPEKRNKGSMSYPSPPEQRRHSPRVTPGASIGVSPTTMDMETYSLLSSLFLNDTTPDRRGTVRPDSSHMMHRGENSPDLFSSPMGRNPGLTVTTRQNQEIRTGTEAHQNIAVGRFHTPSTPRNSRPSSSAASRF